MWYVGQRIVAVSSHQDQYFKKGDEFVIKGLKTACCGIVIDIGMSTTLRCGLCKCGQLNWFNDGKMWFNECRFSPLQSFGEEVTEIISQELEIQYT